MAKRKRFFWWITVILITYLVISSVVALKCYQYHREAGVAIMLTMPMESASDPERVRHILDSFDGIVWGKRVAAFAPPLGIALRLRMQWKEDAIIFFSENLALPESERFTDTKQARKFGHDPELKSDEEIISSAYRVFSGF